jgi:hypothetical protein
LCHHPTHRPRRAGRAGTTGQLSIFYGFTVTQRTTTPDDSKRKALQVIHVDPDILKFHHFTRGITAEPFYQSAERLTKLFGFLAERGILRKIEHRATGPHARAVTKCQLSKCPLPAQQAKPAQLAIKHMQLRTIYWHAV